MADHVTVHEDVVVLVPGFLGFSVFGRFPYFADRVPATLAALLREKWGRDVSIVPASTVPTGPLRNRVETLSAFLGRLQTLGGKRFHLVGHSTGGVDAQLLMTTAPFWGGDWTDAVRAARDGVRSVVTVSAPHYGTCLLDSTVAEFVNHPKVAGALHEAAVPLRRRAIRRRKDRRQPRSASTATTGTAPPEPGARVPALHPHPLLIALGARPPLVASPTPASAASPLGASPASDGGAASLPVMTGGCSAQTHLPYVILSGGMVSAGPNSRPSLIVQIPPSGHACPAIAAEQPSRGTKMQMAHSWLGNENPASSIGVQVASAHIPASQGCPIRSNGQPSASQTSHGVAVSLGGSPLDSLELVQSSVAQAPVPCMHDCPAAASCAHSCALVTRQHARTAKAAALLKRNCRRRDPMRSFRGRGRAEVLHARSPRGGRGEEAPRCGRGRERVRVPPRRGRLPPQSGPRVVDGMNRRQARRLVRRTSHPRHPRECRPSKRDPAMTPGTHIVR
jgi:pimeloyl-ACP methyl ester carboxylesterase